MTSNLSGRVALFLVVFCATSCVFITSSHRLPLTWDEGESIDRAEKILAWFRCERPLTPEAIDEYWMFTRRIEGHPAGYGIVVALGKTFAECFTRRPSDHVTPQHEAEYFLSPKTTYRLGPILLFAFAMAAVFDRVSRHFGRATGSAAVCAILLFPRVFAHAQIAACDSPLTSCWLLAWAFFPYAFARPFRTTCGKTCAVGFWGALLGATFSMKFTGGIAVVPFFLSLFLCGAKMSRDETADAPPGFFVRFFRVIFMRKFLQRGAWFGFALLVALGVFFLLNPPLWFSPLAGMRDFFTLNTNRKGFNIAILFLGNMYDLDHPLPWYNTILWTCVTVPSGFLILIATALFRFVRPVEENEPVNQTCSADPENRRTGFVVTYRFFFFTTFLHAFSLLFVRALPIAPPHDGIRLFVTAFPFLGVTAALGVRAVLRGRIGCAGFGPLRAGRIFVTIVYVLGAGNMAWYAPQWLSYYNAVIGGLPGAARAGMEPTYYWDALDREVADWLAAHVGENESVLFCPASSPKSLALQRRWGELRTDYLPRGVRIGDGRKLRYYILQRRPSGEYPNDVRLIRNAKPVYVKTVRHGGYGIWKLDDVPLLEIYEFGDYLRVLRKHRLQRIRAASSPEREPPERRDRRGNE